MTDERPASLAAQAASWVPPWERAAREPASVDQPDSASVDEPDSASVDQPDAAAVDQPVAAAVDQPVSAAVDRPVYASVDQPDSVEQPDEGSKVDEAGLSDDDDDFDESFEGPNPAGYEQEAPPEVAALPGEADGPASVDAPQELPGEEELEPTEVEGGVEVPLPPAIEEVSEDHADDGVAVDAPIPEDGDDAGDVFDVAADDDVSDDGQVDMPFTEVVPGEEEDDTAALAADDEPFTGSAGESGVASVDSAGTALDGAGASGDALDAGDSVDAGESFVAPGDFGGAGGESGVAPGDFGGAGGESGVAPGDFGGAGRESGVASGDSAAGGSAGAVDHSGGPSGYSDLPVGGALPGRRAGGGAGIPAQGRGIGGFAAAVGAAEKRTIETDLELPLIDDQELRAALEAILLVVDEPVAEMQLAQITEQPTERVATMLEDISARYTAAGHGFDLRRAAGGWRLYTRPEYAPYVERFVLDGQSVRLTQASLETLAVVAYKQPVTRSRISAIRGVNCDGVMRTLVTRGLIEECGTEGETGAFLYRTTTLFLEKLGLNSVDQLPPLAPFLPDDVEEVLDASG